MPEGISAPAPSMKLWRIFAAVGAGVWVIIMLVTRLGPTPVDPFRPFLLLSFLVIAPLSLSLVLGTSRLERAFPLLYVPAALLGSVSLFLKPGTLAGLFAASWLAFTARLLLLAAIRIRDHRFISIAEWAITAGLLYAPIGGLWLVVSRLGLTPLGFQEPLITLTAVHFHVITLGALILTGLVGRKHASLLYRITAAAMIIGPILVAIGITLSVIVEVTGALLLVISALMLALIILSRIVSQARTIAGRILFIVSSLSIIAAMLLAAAYALSRINAPFAITMPVMAHTHGWLNSVGFVLAGLLAFHIEESHE